MAWQLQFYAGFWSCATISEILGA